MAVHSVIRIKLMPIKKTPATLTHYIVMHSWSSAPLRNVRVLPVCFAGVLFFSFIHHQFTIKVHMGCSTIITKSTFSAETKVN